MAETKTKKKKTATEKKTKVKQNEYGNKHRKTKKQELAVDEYREQDVRQMIAAVKNEDSEVNPKAKNNTPHRVISSTGYFSQENVKEFQKEMITHVFKTPANKPKGRGGWFAAPEELEEELEKYFTLCVKYEAVPTISALACWLRCNRDIIYEHARNTNSPFQELCKRAIDYCHMALEMGASESKVNSVAYIFQGKNYFGMKDTQDVRIQAPETEQVNAENSLNALREQMTKESKTTPVLDMHEAEYEEIIK